MNSITVITSRNTKWKGHVARMWENKKKKKCMYILRDLVGNLTETETSEYWSYMSVEY